MTSSGQVATPLMMPAAAPDRELIPGVVRLLAVHIEKAGKCVVIMVRARSLSLLLLVEEKSAREGIAERQRRCSACAGFGYRVMLEGVNENN